MPLLATLEKLDFSSKKVKPFTTHEGSGLGSVMSDVEKYCKNAIIESGLSIVGSNVNNAEEKLESWCK